LCWAIQSALHTLPCLFIHVAHRQRFEIRQSTLGFGLTPSLGPQRPRHGVQRVTRQSARQIQGPRFTQPLSGVDAHHFEGVARQGAGFVKNHGVNGR
jgi:hypothetical protein